MSKKSFMCFLVQIIFLLKVQEIGFAVNSSLVSDREQRRFISKTPKQQKLQSKISKKTPSPSSSSSIPERLLTTKDRRTKVTKPEEYPWSAHGQLMLTFAKNSIYRERYINKGKICANCCPQFV